MLNRLRELLGEPLDRKLKREYEIILIEPNLKLYNGEKLQSLTSESFSYNKGDFMIMDALNLDEILRKLTYSLNKREREFLKAKNKTKLVVRKISPEISAIFGIKSKDILQRCIIIIDSAQNSGMLEFIAMETVCAV